MDGYPVGLVGERNYQAAIRACRQGQLVHVVHELRNPHDAKALVVMTEAGDKLGYVPRDCWLRDAIHDEDKGCDAMIASVSAGEQGHKGVVIDVVLNPDGVQECEYQP